MRVVLLLIVVVLGWAAVGQQNNQSDKNEHKIEGLLRELGSENWRTRKRAYKALEMVADKAVNLLKKAIDETDDLEVRVRIRMLLRYVKVLSPETVEQLRELSKEFLSSPDPRRRAIIRKMRAIEGAANWLIKQLTQKRGFEARKWAVMLHWFQFGRPFLWRERKYSVEELVLIKIVRDMYAYPATRYAALRALARFGTVKGLVTIVHLAAGSVQFHNYKDADPEKFKHFAARTIKKVLKRLKIPLMPPGEDSNWTDFIERLAEVSKEAKEELKRLNQEQLKRRLGLRPLLGVYLPGNIDENRDLGGAKISGAKPGTGADKAGLQSNDLITSIDGWTIRCWNDLVHAVRHCEPGDVVPLTLIRGGKKLHLKVLITSDVDNR